MFYTLFPNLTLQQFDLPCLQCEGRYNETVPLAHSKSTFYEMSNVNKR